MYVYLVIGQDSTVLLAFDTEEHALQTIIDSYGPVNVRRTSNCSMVVENEKVFYAIERHLRLCGPSRL